jgi:hypothetical protein
MDSRRTEKEIGKKLKRKDCRKIEESGDFSSIN